MTDKANQPNTKANTLPPEKQADSIREMAALIDTLPAIFKGGKNAQGQTLTEFETSANLIRDLKPYQMPDGSAGTPPDKSSWDLELKRLKEAVGVATSKPTARGL